MRRLLEKGAILFLWVAVWALVAALVDNDIVLSGPIETLYALGSCAVEFDFWMTVARSLITIVVSFIISAVIGGVLGYASSHVRFVEALLQPIIQLLKSAPIVCIIVILLMSVGSMRVTPIVVFLAVFPSFYFAVLEAIHARDTQFEELLCSFRAQGSVVFLAAIWPSLLPFFISATQSACGLAWKAGVASEFIAMPDGTIGEAIYLSKLTLATSDVLAWLIVIIVLSWLCERVILTLLSWTRISPQWAVRAAVRTAAHQKESTPCPHALFAQQASLGYDGSTVVDDFTVSLPAGSATCFMAPTGSGKTTALMAFSGVLVPQRGQFQCAQAPNTVFQDQRLIESLNGIGNVLLVARHDSEEECRTMLSYVLSENAIEKPVSEYSGGMRRFVEIVRALAASGDVLVLDEPFTGLDEKARNSACELIKRYQRGRTIIMASHHEHDAYALDATIVRLQDVSTLSKRPSRPGDLDGVGKRLS